MDFYTHITLPPPVFGFAYEEPILLIGSCFVENIGAKLEEAKFRTGINPFGTLYNPASIAQALKRLIHPHPFRSEDLFQANGLYHSFCHHSRFSAETEEECLRKINGRLETSARFLSECKRLIITFGTSWVYRLKETGEIVSNCHKLPEKRFVRSRLTIGEIVGIYNDVLKDLWLYFPEITVMFTVSPIRHWKDGAHGNQLSKATLLLAIDELNRLYPSQTAYFPAYEIMMDELRDYRFYADDMLHPSEAAIDYIWKQFREYAFSPQTQEAFSACEEITKAVLHRPFNPQSEAYRQFILQTLLKMERLNEKFPFFDFSKERMLLKSKLK